MCSNSIVPTNLLTRVFGGFLDRLCKYIHLCIWHRFVPMIIVSDHSVPSYTRVELIISSHAVLHVFFVEYCKDSSLYHGTECISSCVPYVLPRMYGIPVVQPSSVVTHVRVHTGDQKPWSLYASWLMLSCRYAPFYVYLLEHLSSWCFFNRVT
jgi:hypothetical protein